MRNKIFGGIGILWGGAYDFYLQTLRATSPLQWVG
jgi:hypothetical protein